MEAFFNWVEWVAGRPERAFAIAINEHYARLHDWKPRFDLYFSMPTVAIISIAFAAVWIQNVRRIRRERHAPPTNDSGH